MFPTRAENVLRSVSVRMKVPEMKVTPSTIASAVSVSRSLWASRPRIMSFCMSGPQCPHPVEHGVGGRVVQPADSPAIGEEQHPVGVGGRTRVVRHHHD
jgi:hypothetical protein